MLVARINGNYYVADRDRESDEIVSSLSDASISQIWFVEARSAIGKSFLTKKIVDKCSKRYPEIEVLVVKTAPHNNGRDVADGGFFSEIFEVARHHFAGTDNASFTTFIASENAQMTDSILLGESINVISEEVRPLRIARRLSGALAKNAFGVGGYERISADLDAASYGSDLQRRYLEHILDHARILLCVDNMQNIDRKSERMLRNLAESAGPSSSAFLFEYTIGEWGDASKQAEYFEASGARIARLILPNLPESHLMEAVKSNCDGLSDSFSLSIDLVNHYRHVANGNLCEVMHYAVNYESHQKVTLNEPDMSATVVRLLDLSDNEKLALGFLVVAKGEIAKAHAREALHMAKADAGDPLRALCGVGLVEDAGDCYRIVHASILDAWASADCFSYLTSEAERWLVAYYEQALGFDSKETIAGSDEYWVPLLSIYAASHPERIDGLFGYVRNGAARVLSPRDIWSFFSRFIACTKSSLSSYWPQYETIMEICFQCELYEEGFEVVTLLENSEDYPHCEWLLLNKSMFLSALDRHADNVALYESEVADGTLSGFVNVNLALISLASYRSLGKVSECQQVARRINNAENINGTYEQGILFRLADVYNPQSRRKALRMIKKSVRLFQRAGNHHQMAKSLISASYLAAQMGRTGWALKSLERAEELLSDLHIGRHMILVNMAAAHLLAGHADERVWSMLDSAEGYAVVPFDKLAIILNKLAWCIMNDEYNKLAILETDALSLADTEPDKHVVCLVFYNLSILFNRAGNIDKSKHYERCTFDLIDYCTPMQARYGYIDKSGFRYLIKREWAVGGLAFWTYDLPEYTSSS